MKRTLRTAAGLALVVTLGAGQLDAQLVSNPVYAWTAGTGVSISGDYGRGMNDESGKRTSLGARVGIGLPMVSLWAGAATVDPNVEGVSNEMTFGGGATLNLFSPPMVPISLQLQAGVGYLNQSLEPLSLTGSVNVLSVPIGVGLIVDVPAPNLDIKPWIAPRINVLRTSLNDASNTEVGFGASGGLAVALPMGLGAHLALDWMTIGDPAIKPFTFGTGIHYNVKLPSLGM